MHPGPDEPEGLFYPMRDTISSGNRLIQMPHRVHDAVLTETETPVIAQPTPDGVSLRPPIDQTVPPLASNPLSGPPVLHESSTELAEREHIQLSYHCAVTSQRAYAILWSERNNPSRSCSLDELVQFICELEAEWPINRCRRCYGCQESYGEGYFQFTLGMGQVSG
jgi:hypothetical protein